MSIFSRHCRWYMYYKMSWFTAHCALVLYCMRVCVSSRWEIFDVPPLTRPIAKSSIMLWDCSPALVKLLTKFIGPDCVRWVGLCCIFPGRVTCTVVCWITYIKQQGIGQDVRLTVTGTLHLRAGLVHKFGTCKRTGLGQNCGLPGSKTSAHAGLCPTTLCRVAGEWIFVSSVTDWLP